MVDCKMGQSLAPCDMDQQKRHLWAKWHALLPQGRSLQLNRCHMSSSAGRLHRFANGSNAAAPRADVVLSSDVRLSSDMAASRTSGCSVDRECQCPVKGGVDGEFMLEGSGGVLLAVPQASLECLRQGLRE